MSTIDERWTPASTARREPLSHFVAVDRTRNAVVLDSIGPPPEPYHINVSILETFSQSPSAHESWHRGRMIYSAIARDHMHNGAMRRTTHSASHY